MKVLLVSSTLPGAPSESSHGIFRRLDMFVEALKLVADQFDMLFYVPAGFNAENRADIKSQLESRWQISVNLFLCHRNEINRDDNFWNNYCRPSLSFHHVSEYEETSGAEQLSALEERLDNEPDLIFVHRLRCMPPFLLTKRELPPVYFDMDDIEHVAFRRNIKMPPLWRSKWLYNLQLPAIMFGERKAIKLSQATFVCSAQDRLDLQKLSGKSNITVIPNALRMPDIEPLASEPKILIIGQYKYAPNRIGVEYFLDRVWHLIVDAKPNAELIIAGPSPELIKHYAAPPKNTTFPGFVENLDALYKAARIVACPILSGGGTRVKIIEAASYGRPVISTTIGAEGLSFTDGENIFIRDEPPEIAEICLQLFADDNLCMKIGSAARLIAQNSYDKKAIVNNIVNVLRRKD